MYVSMRRSLREELELEQREMRLAEQEEAEELARLGREMASYLDPYQLDEEPKEPESEYTGEEDWWWRPSDDLD
jgi:hypothetical protein